MARTSDEDGRAGAQVLRPVSGDNLSNGHTKAIYPLRAEGSEGDMGETSLVDIVIKRMDAFEDKLDELGKSVSKMQRDTDLDLQAIRRDVRDLQDWRTRIEQLPEKREERMARQSTITWQSVNGYLGLLSLGVVLISTVLAPIIASHWH